MKKAMAATAAFLILTGCDGRPNTTENRADYVEWCQDKVTKVRVADSLCDQGIAQWVYSLNGKAPLMGDVASATNVRPTTGTVGRAPEGGKFGTIPG